MAITGFGFGGTGAPVGWGGGGLFGGPGAAGWGMGPGGTAIGAGPGWGGGLGGLGSYLPTAAGRVAGGAVPQYFIQTPTGFAPLSPLAQAYLSRMFPAGLWGEETKEYTITPYSAGELGVGEILPVNEAGGQLGGVIAKAPVPGTVEVKGITEKVTPKPASAQLYRQLEAQGALPNLRQYVEDILQVPWETYVGTMQAYWPSAQTERPVSWATTKQR